MRGACAQVNRCNGTHAIFFQVPLPTRQSRRGHVCLGAMAGIWQVEVWEPRTGQAETSLWLDFCSVWNSKLEYVYGTAVVCDETDNAIVLLYHDEAAADHVVYEVDVDNCTQKNVTTGKVRRVRRVDVSHVNVTRGKR